jgi:hypothetical protein
MKVSPLVLDMVVHSGKLLNSLPAPVAGFLSAADASVYPAKLGLCGLVIAGILDCCPITENGKACNPDINAGNLAGLGQWRWVGHNHAETGIPLPTYFGEGDCFDLSGNFPVQLYL